MDTNYQLVNSVDPSKCQPKIREKFAKLTLSSNKKKQQNAEQVQQIRDEARLSNVSRNLLSELLTDDECDEGQKVKPKSSENLLIRTDSSSSNQEVNAPPRPLLDNSDSTRCSELEKSFRSCEAMEPLRVSDVGTTEPGHIDDVIEQLSSRISSLAVVAEPILITSGEDSHERSEIVSTENQAMDCGQRFPDVLKAEPIREPEVSICISSSSDETPITVTDSEDEFDAVNLSSSGTNLPPTQEGTKDLRMAAFLNDVRQYHCAPADSLDPAVDRQKQIAMADTESMTTGSFALDSPNKRETSENETPRNRVGHSDKKAKNRQIADADTEPVTPENISISTNHARRIATADTVSMTTEDQSPVKSLPDIPQRNYALDDTEDVTQANETAQSSPRYAPVMNVAAEFLEDSLHKLSNSLPDDSLTVAETSEEETEEKQKTPPPPATEDQLRPSRSLSEVASKDSSASSRHGTHLQINIATKINIKIQVSQSINDSVSPDSSKTSRSDSKSSTESSGDDHAPQSSAQKAQIEPTPFEEIPHSPPERDISTETEKSDDFAETAHRILNEVYGDTWKTPEVLRTLKKVAATSTRKATNLRPKRLDIEQCSRDESTLDDFSIFKKNIPQDLDSTRLPTTPVMGYENPEAKVLQRPLEMSTQVRNEDKEHQARWRAQIDSDTELETCNSPTDRQSSNPKPAETSESNPEMDGIAYLASTKGGDASPFSPEMKTASLSKEGIQPELTPKEEDTKTPLKALNTFKLPKAAATDSKVFRGHEQITDQIPALRTPQERGVTSTKSGRKVRPLLTATAIIDSESDGENASDDQDKSWSESGEDDENISDKSLKELPPVQPDRTKKASRSKKRNNLVYLDLSKAEVEVQNDVPESPPANHDEKFNRRLEEILRTCKAPDKPKIEGTPNIKTKRKLFTATLNDNEENTPPPFDSPRERMQTLDYDERTVSISGVPMPARFEPFNKHLESVKLGKPIFKIQTPKTNRNIESSVPRTPKSAPRDVGDMCTTPRDKYGFLQSLDVCVGKSMAHPAAVYYKDNFRQKKEELTQKLYELYNKQCFNQELEVVIDWNKKLTNTAGRCINRKRLGKRTCLIELSDKVITSPDRLRCTLIHELCHAASWIFNGEGGHGATWKAWARKANQVFPELPKITVCHQYEIEYKYTYKCTLCGAKSHAHSKSKKVENIRCSYCHGAIEVYLNRKDKEGNIMSTPVREPTGFAKFVKDKYKQYKRPDLKHADVMKLLSTDFASMKVDAKA